MINEKNYLKLDNNVTIATFSSQIKGCNAENILNTDNKVKFFKKYFWIYKDDLAQRRGNTPIFCNRHVKHEEKA